MMLNLERVCQVGDEFSWWWWSCIFVFVQHFPLKSVFCMLFRILNLGAKFLDFSVSTNRENFAACIEKIYA